ncbi:MAG: hypothetical protein KatS3mg015_2828 [Fimbriimonadales bacterium]|nr:MAG: hypothetical protein KatS3mg015_2828 [Fimbriimonadales bacterium]
MTIPIFIQVNPQWLYKLNVMLQVAHDFPKDFDDTLTVNLTRRDYALLMIGADVLVQFHPCLEEDLKDLVARMIELRNAQKPDWDPEET